MQRFCARILEVSKMAAIGEHLANCPECHQIFHEVFQKRRNFAPVVIDLSPEKWLRDEHLDYEWLTAYVDNAMEKDEREMMEIHLRLCGQCREEVEEFIAWRRKTEPELKVRYMSDDRAGSRKWVLGSWDWLSMTRKPAYAFAVLLAIAAITLAILFLKSGSNNRDEQQVNASPSPSVLVSTTPIVNSSPTPDLVVKPTPQIRASPGTQPQQAGSKNGPPNTITLATKPTISLNDGNRVVAIDLSGKLTGLAKLPPELERSIRQVLLSEEVERPAVLTDLEGNRGDLRGEGNQSSFKLLSPTRAVVSDDRPVFKWESLRGAESYRVYVSDSRSRKVADSGLLSRTESQWSPPSPLKRGEVYSWTVGGVINGEEIVSPSASEPEVKFKVLSEEEVRQLSLLRQTTNSHLALGVFYAQAGMIAEAEREFQKLADRNPNSPIVRRLLNTLRSWR
ncbi:MAG: zf-HC2 domain-containing protein [Blastocatellales bacterium]